MSINKVPAVIQKILHHPEKISDVQLISNSQKILLFFNYDQHPLQMSMELDFLTAGKLVTEHYAFGGQTQAPAALYRTTEKILQPFYPDFARLFNHLSHQLRHVS